MEARRSFEDRFWSYVKKGNSDECWPWLGSLDSHGYGKIHVYNDITLLAHRVSWELAYGSIPTGLCVLHHCDNPRCVNPDHLFLGTHEDNARDRESKHRGNHGRLTPQDVLEIYALSNQACMPQREIGLRYGIDGNTVSDIKLGITWNWITGANREEKMA